MPDERTAIANHGSPLPIVGRADVVRAADDALEQLSAGSSVEGLLLAGLRGSGRTTLLQWFSGEAHQRGWLVATVPGEGQPTERLWRAMAAVATALRQRRPGALAVRELDAALAAPIPIGMEVAACRRVVGAAAAAADECRTQLVLCIDDADRWGESTAAVLETLLQPARRGRPVLVAAAFLPAVQVAAGTPVLALGPLQLHEVLDAALPIDEAGRRHLWEASRGWPALLQVLLHVDRERWSLEAHDHYERLTDALSPAERRYLDAVAVLAPGPVAYTAVASALGDSTRFTPESSLLAGVRHSLIETGLLYGIGDSVDIAVAGYREHLTAARHRG